MDPDVKKFFKRADPTLYPILLKVESKLIKLEPKEHSDYFLELLDSIVSQQLSGKVATVIFNRFKNLFKDGEISPEAILKISDAEIRGVGISYGKISYIKDLATKVLTNEVDLNSLNQKSDIEVINELTKVKGIGPWTAEMFLIFTLVREDVFSYGDLGLQNAIKKIYGIEKKERQKLEELVNKWSPFKSYASRILWKSLDNE